jgi:hypothetical protein
LGRCHCLQDGSQEGGSERDAADFSASQEIHPAPVSGP